MSTHEFHDMVAIVTGGASGIGMATALRLTELGATVACLDLNTAALPEHLHAYECDVADRASVDAAVEAVAARFGRIDVVVANAGIGAQGGVEDNSDDEWAHVLNINVVGMARTIAAAMPYLRRSPAGAVVLTSSIAAWAGLPQRALYSASKGAVQALGLAIAADCLADGVRVNVVAPGTAATPWVDRLLGAAADPVAERVALELRQPIGRLVQANEVAEAIVYLASPRAASTTGTVLAVDGGMHGLRPRPRPAPGP